MILWVLLFVILCSHWGLSPTCLWLLERKSFDLLVHQVLHVGRSFITYDLSIVFVVEHDAFVNREDWKNCKGVLVLYRRVSVRRGQTAGRTATEHGPAVVKAAESWIAGYDYLGRSKQILPIGISLLWPDGTQQLVSLGVTAWDIMTWGIQAGRWSGPAVTWHYILVILNNLNSCIW